MVREGGGEGIALTRFCTFSQLASVPEWTLRVLRSTYAYLLMSAIFFIGLIYQAVMFYSFVALGLVDLET